MVQLRVHNLVGKVEPNALVIAAVVTTACERAIVIDRAATRLTFQMDAITILVVPRNHVRPTKIPPNDMLLHILFGERELETAARRLAQMNAVFTVNLGPIFKRVLASWGFLRGDGHAPFDVILAQSIGLFG